MFQTKFVENNGTRIYVHVARTFSDIALVHYRYRPQYRVSICILKHFLAVTPESYIDIGADTDISLWFCTEGNEHTFVHFSF